MLKAENVTVRYGARTVVQDLSFELKEGEWLMLVGPNGAGKSTLIEAIAGGVPYAGKITLAGRNIRAFRASELARRIGVLAQKNAVSYAYSVEEVVSLGRYAHASGFLASRDDDGGERVERALELTRRNAELNGMGNIHAATADGIPAETTFDLIWSNPPIRVGKEVLHTLLMTWLPRLNAGGAAYLVVQKNLGSDSLIPWLATQLGDGYEVSKYASSKGFRVIEVMKA